MAATATARAISAAVPVTGAAVMVAEFRQGVKDDFFDVFADSCPLLRLEHPQPGTLQLDAGACADVADNDAVHLLAAQGLHRLARAVGVVRIGVVDGC